MCIRDRFDDKVPQHEDYRWKGDKESGPRWKTKVRAYFIAKCSSIKWFLDWAESKDFAAVTMEELKSVSASAMTGHEAVLMSQQVWGFLSQCLTGNAFEYFRGADELNGFDAWRRLILIIEEGRPRLLEELREKVRDPEPIKDLQNIGLGIDKFVRNINELAAAGGRKIEDAEMKTDLLHLLP